MKTSRLEQIRRRLADEYMETFPGVTRQTAKRRVEPRARMLLGVAAINASAQDTVEVIKKMAPAFNEVARSMRVFGEAHKQPEKASPFYRNHERRVR